MISWFTDSKKQKQWLAEISAIESVLFDGIETTEPLSTKNHVPLVFIFEFELKIADENQLTKHFYSKQANMENVAGSVLAEVLAHLKAWTSETTCRDIIELNHDWTNVLVTRCQRSLVDMGLAFSTFKLIEIRNHTRYLEVLGTERKAGSLEEAGDLPAAEQVWKEAITLAEQQPQECGLL